MTVQVGRDVFGVFKQTAKGSLGAQPTFAHGLADGTLDVKLSQGSDPLTSAYLSPATAFRDGALAGGELTFRAMLKSIGLYLYGALGAVSTVGTNPYTHTITLGAALPYLSCYQKKGDATPTIEAVQDCKVDELTLSWEENKPVVVKLVVAGTVFSYPASFTPGTDESDTVSYFTPAGGTFKLDVDSGTAVTTLIKGGSVSIKRGVKQTAYSGTIVPADSDEGACAVEVGFTLRPADLTDWRAILTGTPAGTTVSEVPVYGSFEHTFVSGAASLKLAATKVEYLCDQPGADPAGGAADIELSGRCYRNTTTPITCTLINAQVSY